MSFWLDRQPTADETGAHLSGSYTHGETIVSHLAYVAAALTNTTLTPDQRHRADRLVGSIIERLRGETE